MQSTNQRQLIPTERSLTVSNHFNGNAGLKKCFVGVVCPKSTKAGHSVRLVFTSDGVGVGVGVVVGVIRELVT